MHLTGWLAGMISAELTSADLIKALDEIRAAGIELHSLCNITELSCTYTIHRKYWKALCEMCERRGYRLRKIRKTGLYWRLRCLRTRPVLMVGCCLLFVLILVIPTRVFFIQVEGNQQLPDNLILEAAEECGIHFGASRRKVRSEQMKNALLARIDSLQWAGINTTGCTATISVREREQEKKKEYASGVSSIVADRDGYILSCTGTRGTVLVQPGQSVKEGTLLISGYTDCGLSIRAERAEGELVAVTQRKLEVLCPAQYRKKSSIRASGKKIGILLGKKRINLWKGSGILGATCGRIYKEYYITLPGGFRLPFALCIDAYFENNLISVTQDSTAAQNQLTDCAAEYLSGIMIAGEILRAEHQVQTVEAGYRLYGCYACKEMIGRERWEQNGDIYGKNS